MPACSKIFIDIGNTNIKWKTNTAKKINIENINSFNIAKLPKADMVWVSTVSNFDIADNIKTNFTDVHLVKTKKYYKNLTNAYPKVSSLGIDRWLALIAVYHLYPKQDVVIIDIGSALTFDLLTKDYKHKGGLIMPGLNFLRKSMPIFSDDSNKIAKNISLANNTKKAWQNGTFFMLIDTINSRIANLKIKYQNLIVVITGSYAHKLKSYLPDNCIYHNNLVIKGLEFYSNTTR